MRREAFFNRFELLAEVHAAIPKLRVLILQLAVQGRLVAQSKADGRAADLFATERTILSEPVEPRYEVPTSWLWIPFASVGDQRLGKMLDQKGNRGKLKPYLRNTNVQWMRFELDDVKHLRLEPSELEEYRLRDGDLLICEGGEPGRCAIWRGEKTEMYFQKALHRVRPRAGILVEYLAINLRADASNGVLAQHFTGATIKHLTGRSLEKYAIPLPPLAEQKRIVAKVDELMALCDRLEAQQKERETRHAALARASLTRFADAPTPANLTFLFHKSYTISPADLRKSILTLAVRGKIVPQDPRDEPARNLVTRVGAEKTRLVTTNVIKSESVMDPILDQEKLFPLPKSWAWVRAGDLCRLISSGSTPDQSVFRSADGIPYLKVYNIRNQRVEFEYKSQFITRAHHDKSMKRSRLFPGDVIMNIVGPPLGKVAIVPSTFPEWNCNQAIAFFRPVLSELGPYLYTFLKEGTFLQNIHLIGTAGQDNISVTKCKFIPIPLPPLTEQRRIVAKVDQLMALVDELEAQLAAAQPTAANLLDAIVSELTA